MKTGHQWNEEFNVLKRVRATSGVWRRESRYLPNAHSHRQPSWYWRHTFRLSIHLYHVRGTENQQFGLFILFRHSEVIKKSLKTKKQCKVKLRSSNDTKWPFSTRNLNDNGGQGVTDELSAQRHVMTPTCTPSCWCWCSAVYHPCHTSAAHRLQLPPSCWPG